MSITNDGSNPLKDAAHTYRNRGWRVIQIHKVGPDGVTCSCNKGANCTSAGKHPVNNAWQNTERYSAADVEALWEKMPKANVGIATGAPSGFWVLDLDPKDDGVTEFGKLIAEHGGEFPETYAVQTGSGGYHYYFEMPDFDVQNSAGRVAPGVDVRGTGGQVVAPPSVSSKGVYTVVRAVKPVQAPAWLLELIKKPEHTGPIVTAEDLPKPGDIPVEEWERLNGYTKKAVEANLARLDALAKNGWEGEPWNHTLFEVCCANLEFANSPWNAYSLGQAQQDIFERSPRDNAGFDDATVAKTWNSAREKVGDKARAVPAGRSRGPAAPPPAQDPLFSSPDVRGRQDPPQPDGSVPPSGGNHVFWVGKQQNELDVTALADAIFDLGPIAWAREKAFWSWDERGVWVPDHDAIRYRCVDLLGAKYRNTHADNASTVVQRHAAYLDGEPLSQWMNFPNGMLDWQTGDLVPHDPDLKSTVQFEVNWNPAAECPTFDRFLSQVMHEDYVRMAWEMIGYLMYSGNPLQVAFLLYGTGGNGKGTLIRVIESILGKENLAAESLDDLNGNRFSSVNLYGKIANIAGDIDGTYQETTANFKKLTGEDMIAAERKFGQRFKFENWAVPVFSANKIPGSADVTEGYLRRWIVLHFDARFTDGNRILGLSDILATEVEGIVVKAVSALRTLMERREFHPEGEAARGKEMFANQIDQVRQWLADPGPFVHAAPESYDTLRSLYSTYSKWAHEAGGKAVRENEFGQRLQGLGYERFTQDGVPCYKGLKVTPHITTPQNFFGRN